MEKSRVLIRIVLAALVGFFPLVDALADSPKVTAVLSNSEVAVGEVVQLQIRVTGANEANTPGEIDVTGLEIHPTGTSRQFEMRNFDVTSTVTYNYTILPLKTGTYKIPPQTVRVGSSSLQTPELRLNVVGAQGGSAGSNPGNPSAQTAAGRTAYAELLLPKKTAYVGEMIPVVIRLVFFTRAKLEEPPQFTAQGFTAQKLQAPDESENQVIDGRKCDVLTYKTAIAAARPGKFEIEPIKAVADVAVPRQTQSGSRRGSPFDVFNLDDPFSDPFFSSPFGSVTAQRRTLATEATSIEIKPLPANAPPDFSGAVGNFSMTVDANPKNVQLGDPITVTATITGRGNFDRVSAPALEDDRGWHKYPPSSKFKQDDDVGISGTKVFETVISPNEKKQSISPFHFSFFDPQKEQYVALRSDSIPIRVEGGAAPATTPPSAAIAPIAASPSPTTKLQVPAKPGDILYQLNDRPAGVESFAPVYMRQSFWLAQLLPLLALLVFIGWKVRQARLEDREAQRTAALHHEAAELIRRLRRDGGSPQEYYKQASRAVRIKTALVTHGDPNAVDAEAVAAAFHLSDISRDQLRRLFERSDELRYSGAHNGSETVPPEQRQEVLHLIENLQA